MKNILKIVVTTALVLSILIAGGNPKYLAQSSATISTAKYSIKDGYIVDDQGRQYYNFVDGSGRNLSLEEALIILNEEASIEDYDQISMPSLYEELIGEYTEPQAIVPVVPVVDVISINKTYVGPAQKVSPDFRGPCTMEYTTSSSVEYSISNTLGVSVENDIVSFIGFEYNVSITISETQTETYSISTSLNTGEVAAVYFKPYYVRVVGRYNGNTSIPFTAYYPKLLATQRADGIFYIEKK